MSYDDRYISTPDFDAFEAAARSGLSVFDIFTHRVCEIPRAQRDYQWDADRVKNIINNILDVAQHWHNSLVTNHNDGTIDYGTRIPSFYSCGAITALESPDKDPRGAAIQRKVWTIIDGQQRLTTIALIAAAYNDLVNPELKNGKAWAADPRTLDADWCGIYERQPGLCSSDQAFSFNRITLEGNGKTRWPVMWHAETAGKVKEEQGDFYKALMGDFAEVPNPKPDEDADFAPTNKQVVAIYKVARDYLAEKLRPGANGPGFQMFGAALQHGIRFAVVLEPAKNSLEALEKFIVLNTGGLDLRQIDIIKTALMQNAEEELRSAGGNKSAQELHKDAQKQVQDLFRKMEKKLPEKSADKRVRMWLNALVSADAGVKQAELVKTLRSDMLDSASVDFRGLRRGNKSEHSLKAGRFLEGLTDGAERIGTLLGMLFPTSQYQSIRDLVRPLLVQDSFAAIALSTSLNKDHDKMVYEVARGLALRSVLQRGAFSSTFEAKQQNLQVALRNTNMSVAECRKEVENAMLAKSTDAQVTTVPTRQEAHKLVCELNYIEHPEQVRIVLLVVERYLRERLGVSQHIVWGDTPHLEHVQPQSSAGCACLPGSHSDEECWGDTSLEKSTVHNIGNLTLLNAESNTSIGGTALYGNPSSPGKLSRYVEETQPFLVTRAVNKGFDLVPAERQKLKDECKDLQHLLTALQIPDGEGDVCWTAAGVRGRASAIANLFLDSIEYGTEQPKIVRYLKVDEPQQQVSQSVTTPSVLPDRPEVFTLTVRLESGADACAYASRQEGHWEIAEGSTISADLAANVKAAVRELRKTYKGSLGENVDYPGQLLTLKSKIIINSEDDARMFVSGMPIDATPHWESGGR